MMFSSTDAMSVDLPRKMSVFGTISTPHGPGHPWRRTHAEAGGLGAVLTRTPSRIDESGSISGYIDSRLLLDVMEPSSGALHPSCHQAARPLFRSISKLHGAERCTGHIASARVGSPARHSAIESLACTCPAETDHVLSSVLCYSGEPLSQPVLRLPRALAEKAVKISAGIHQYCESGDPSCLVDRLETAAKILATTLRNRSPELTNEVFLQLVRHTRRNPDPENAMRYAELFQRMSPSLASALFSPLSLHFHILRIY